MSNIKPININPELFKVSNKKNKTSKVASNTIIKPNILRKELLARIKSHRNNKLKQSFSPSSPISPSSPSSPATKIPIKIENKNKINKVENDKDADDFSQSIDFLKSLSKKKQNSLTKKTNFPLEKTITPTIPITTIQPPISMDSMASTTLVEVTNDLPTNTNKTPIYGCLKNGNLPTFRTFKNKTIKKPYSDSNTILNIKEENNVTINPIVIESDKNELVSINMDDLLSPAISPAISPEISPAISPEIIPEISLNAPIQEKCLTKPKTIKYTLGKKDNIVSVLIKNAHTRKNIVDSIARIKETKMTDMKKYLKQHNLLKSGSKCPPDVIKKLYEQSFLCGIIKNNNKDNLIENFLNN